MFRSVLSKITPFNAKLLKNMHIFNHVLLLVHILGFLLLTSVVTAEDLLLSDGRLFDLQNPEEFAYILKDESPSSLERLYVLTNKVSIVPLLCPKGYSIVEVRKICIAFYFLDFHS